MNIDAMNCFLSKENINKHFEHLRQAKLKFSVLEKSFPEINGVYMNKLKSASIDRRVKNYAIWLLKYIKSHDLFFNSFSLARSRCDNIKKYYSSRERFIYEIFELAKSNDNGFVFAYIDRKRGPQISFSSDFAEPFTKYDPILALDIYEHTYFADYGFAKDKFLNNALSYLNVEMLDIKLS